MRTFGPLIKNQENWLAVLLGSLSIYFFIKTFGYRPAAALFPRIVSAVVAVLCFSHLCKNIWKAFPAPLKPAETGTTAAIRLPWQGSAVVVLLYLLLIALLGFVWATGIFMLYAPAAAGYRKWPVIIVTALAMTILIEISFNRFLQIQLHEGFLFTLFP